MTTGSDERHRPVRANPQLDWLAQGAAAGTPVEPIRRSGSPVPGRPGVGAPWTLEECINKALSSNRSLSDVDAAVLGAEYTLQGVKAQFQFELRPLVEATVDSDGNDRVGAGLGLTKGFRYGTVVDAGLQTVRTDDGNETTARISLVQPLLRGSHRSFVEQGIDSARFALRSSTRSRHVAQGSIAVATADAVYRVVRERETLRLSEESVARSAAHLEAIQARERAGLSDALDVFRGTQQLGRAQNAENISKQAFSDALDALRILLALPLETPLEVVAPLEVEVVDISLKQAISLGLTERVELSQAVESLGAAIRRARVAEIAAKPDVALALTVAQTGFGTDLEDSLDLRSPRLGLSLSTASGFRRLAEKAAARQAALGVEVAERSRWFQEDLVVQGIKRAYRSVEQGKRSIEIQRGQVQEARGKLIVAKRKFELGLGTNFDVVEAEGELRSSQAALISSFTSTMTSQFQLRASMGTLLETPDELRR